MRKRVRVGDKIIYDDTKCGFKLGNNIFEGTIVRIRKLKFDVRIDKRVKTSHEFFKSEFVILSRRSGVLKVQEIEKC